MKKPTLAIITCLLILNLEMVSTQLDSILHQGIYRTFIVHIPKNFPTKPVPLVLNFHGLNSNAAQQELYSQFNRVADSLGFIVVYPNAVNGSWNFSSDKDVDFISKLIDTIRPRYSISGCLFLTGMSMGGFMCYHLACSLNKEITAIAVVAGNMLHVQQRFCNPLKGLPVLHFHGTMDAIVSYQGASGIPPVDSTIQWWVQQNNCNPDPVVFVLPDLDPTDRCHVLDYMFKAGRDNSEVRLYKIIDGGHTWPGAFPVPALGPTNQDIQASQIIGGFFRQHCQGTTNQQNSKNDVLPYIIPNPANLFLQIKWADQNYAIRIWDINGNILIQQKQMILDHDIDLSILTNGIYFLELYNQDIRIRSKIFVIH